MIAIQGNGVAACCCARLLQGREVSIAPREENRLSVPAVMLGDTARTLAEDAFDDRTIFEGLHKIRQRIVLWGPSAEPVALPHSGIILSENNLLDRLWPKIHLTCTPERSPRWRIQCAGRLSPEHTEHRFGSRIAVASELKLSRDASRDACWVESVENGWLFLISSGEGNATLLAIGGSSPELLDGSRLIAKQIGEHTSAGFQFNASPRARSPLFGEDWIACGTAALGFDPIAGEGVGNSIREAVLASAVIRAILRGGDIPTLMNHYSTRLMSGFLRHLENCKSFYKTGGTGLWWTTQEKELDRGISWVRSLLESVNFPPRYRLVDFDLESLV